MKRFLLFYGSFDTLQDALAFLNESRKDWFQIVDTKTETIVDSAG